MFNKKLCFIICLMVVLTLICSFTACRVKTDEGYTITVHPANGSADFVWEKGTDFPTLTKENCDGYQLYLDQGYTTLVTLEDLSNMVLQKDIDVYVKWAEQTPNVPNYTVTVHPSNGGENVVWQVGNQVPTFKKVGYVVDGFYIDEALTQSIELSDDLVLTENLDVWVKWTECTAHSGRWIVDTPATCTTDGSRHRTCTICDKYIEDSITASGHTLHHHSKLDATCTNNGVVEYWSCSICGNNYSDDKGTAKLDNIVINALGHNYGQWITEVSASCVQAGVKGHFHCDGCNKNFDDEKNIIVDLSIAPAGHKMDHHEKVDADCVNDGVKEYWSCSKCNKNYADENGNKVLSSIVIDALGHSYDHYYQETPPTCIADGTKAHFHCEVCDKNFDVQGAELKDLSISNEGVEHDYTDLFEKVEPTCCTTGTKEYFLCGVCGKKFDENENEITDLVIPVDETNHDYDIIDAVPSTCTKLGVEEHVHCNACGKNFDIDFNEISEVPTIAINPNNHNFTDGDCSELVPATCISDGNVEYIQCADCQKYFDLENNELESIVIPKNPNDIDYHDPDIMVEGVPATCTSAGVLEHFHCKLCNKNYDYDCNELTKTSIDKLPHNMTFHEGFDATCTTDGEKEYWSCSLCSLNYADEDGNTVISDIVIKCIGHIYDNYVDKIEPTCIAEGSKAYVHCATCDKNFDRETGDELTDLVLEKVAHDMTHHEKVDSTCTEEGVKEYWSCSKCSVNYADEEGSVVLNKLAVDALGHDMTHHKKVDATCTEDGVKEYWSCANCNKNFADKYGYDQLTDLVINKLGHDMTHHEKVDATCTEEGVKEYWSCANCDKNFADENGVSVLTDLVINALGHDYNDWTNAKAPTCTDDGNLKYHQCKVEGCAVYQYVTAEGSTLICSAKEFDSKIKLSATGHSMNVHAKVDATCTEDGVLTHWTCSNCDKVFGDAKGNSELTDLSIPKLGHSMTHHSKVNPTCTKEGKKEYWTCSVCNVNFGDANGNSVLTDLSISANGHNYGEWIAEVPAGCITTGVKAHYNCSACNTNFDINKNVLSSLVIKAVGHDFTVLKHDKDNHWYECSADGCTKIDKKEAHAWDNGVLTKDPTEQEEGEKTYACELCQEEKIVQIGKLDHVHTFNESVWEGNDSYHWHPATCPHTDEKGDYSAHTGGNATCTTKAVCETCSKDYGKVLGHNMTHHEKVEPTCTEEGVKEYWYCSNCDKNFADKDGKTQLTDLTIKANGHDYNDWINAKAPTCTDNGNLKYHQCKVESCKVYEYIDAQGKTLICSADEFDSKIKISALGHDFDNNSWVNAKAPTCTDDGNLKYHQCKADNCGVYQYVTANGDTLTCNANEFDSKIKLYATGHKMDHHKKVEPTCTEEGVKEYWSCSNCGKNFADKDGNTQLTDLTINANGHDYNDWNNAKAPTCTDNGNLKYHQCKVESCKAYEYVDAQGKTLICGADEFDSKIKLSAIGHDMTHHEYLDSTCVAEGNVEYWSCSNCGKNFADKDGNSTVDNTVINAKGHDYNDWINAKAPTCTDNGNLKYHQCKVESCKAYEYVDAQGKTLICGADEYDSEIKLSAIGHDMTHHEYLDSTCVAEGNVEYWSCSNCGKNFADKDGINVISGTIINLKDHDMTICYEYKAPTCTDEGVVEHFYCKNCGKNYDSDIEPLDKTTIDIDPTAHDYGEDIVAEVPATCVSKGEVAHFHCIYCNKNFDGDDKEITDIATIPINPNAHKFDEEKAEVPATCISTGTKAYSHCEYCDKYYDASNKEITDLVIPINRDNHEPDENYTLGDTEVPATCTTDGTKEHFHCTLCEKYFSWEDYTEEEGYSENITISALGHDYNDWINAKAPTCTEDGNLKYHQCTRTNCGVYEYVDAEGTKTCEAGEFDTYIKVVTSGHNYGSLIPEVPANCTETGTKAHYHCDKCSLDFDESYQVISTQDLIIPITHKFGTLNAKVDATYWEEGTKEYKTCFDCNGNFDKDGEPLASIVIEKLASNTYQEYVSACSSNTQVTVLGYISYKKGNSRLWLVDADGYGYYAYSFSSYPSSYNVGDEVALKGTAKLYNGLYELENCSIVGASGKTASENSVNIDYVDRTSQFSAESPSLDIYQGTLVSLVGVTMVESNGDSLKFKLGSNEYTFYVASSISTIISSAVRDNFKNLWAAGATANIRGIVSKYNDYQIMPVDANGLDEDSIVLTDSAKLDNISGIPTSVSANFTLPTEVNGSAITWSSDNTAIAIGENGSATVTRGDSDITVTLTATINSSTKNFTVVVINENTNTVTISIADYASENGWGSSACNTTLNNTAFTATAIGGANTGKYYSDWRFYQSENAKLKIEAASRYTIVSVKITYSISDNGVLKNGNTEVESGTIVPVNGTLIEFSVGNTNNKTNGQVKITAIEVVCTYTPPTDQEILNGIDFIGTPDTDEPTKGVILANVSTLTLDDCADWAIEGETTVASISNGVITFTHGDFDEEITLVATRGSACREFILIVKAGMTAEEKLNKLKIIGEEVTGSSKDNHGSIGVSVTTWDLTQTTDGSTVNGVVWTVVSGSEYASISDNTVTFTHGTSDGEVVIRATLGSATRDFNVTVVAALSQDQETLNSLPQIGVASTTSTGEAYGLIYSTVNSVDLDSTNGITWTIKSGEGATISGNTLTVTHQATEERTIVVTATLNDASRDFTVKVEPSTWTATMQYEGSTTTNMVASPTNNASTVNLDADLFTVLSSKKDGYSVQTGLNGDGTIRIYGSSNTTLTVRINAGYIIDSIEIVLAQGSVRVTDGTTEISKTNGSYSINGLQFVIDNTASSQARIKSVKIAYSRELPDQQKLDRITLPSEATANFDLGKVASSWTSNNNDAISITGNATSGFTANVTRGDSDVSVTLTATLGEATKDFTVTVKGMTAEEKLNTISIDEVISESFTLSNIADSWEVTDIDPEGSNVIVIDGYNATITRGNTDVVVIITATLDGKTKEFIFTVPAAVQESTDQEKLDALTAIGVSNSGTYEIDSDHLTWTIDEKVDGETVTGIVWEVTSGSSYASISGTTITFTPDTADQTVTIKATLGTATRTFTVKVLAKAQSSTPVTETITLSSKGWSNATQHTTLTGTGFSVNLTGGTNTGKYYASGTNWRIYQSENPTITVSANAGYKLVSVKITYSSSSGGVLQKDGTNVTTNTVVTVNGTSIVFGVGNTGTATNGQVRITEIQVVYQAV